MSFDRIEEYTLDEQDITAKRHSLSRRVSFKCHLIESSFLDEHVVSPLTELKSALYEQIIT